MQSVAGKVAQDYCRKFPGASSHQIARMLRRDEPKLFRNFDTARCAVRYYRGFRGRTPKPIPLTAPAAAPTTFGVHELTPGLRYLVLADVHVPYHDREALTVAVKTAKAERCNAVLLNGDILDFYQLSRFNKDPRRAPVQDEIAAAGTLVDWLAQELKPKHFLWKLGNHEVRWQHYLQQRAPELLGLTVLDLGEVVQAERRGVKMIPGTWVIRHGKLIIVHGHEWARGLTSPVNPARGAFLRTITNTISAHQHQSSNHTEHVALGPAVSCWSLGCLCDLHPEYATLNRWGHGFGILDTREPWRFSNYKIINGEAML